MSRVVALKVKYSKRKHMWQADESPVLTCPLKYNDFSVWFLKTSQMHSGLNVAALHAWHPINTFSGIPVNIVIVNEPVL